MKNKPSKKLEEGVYVIEENKTQFSKENTKEVYTLLGKQDKLNDDLPILTGKDADTKETAYAKKETIGGQTRYYIKIDEKGDLVDPLAIMPSLNTLRNKLIKDDKSQYKKVTEECFKHYLMFLKTSNKTQYKYAQRTKY